MGEPASVLAVGMVKAATILEVGKDIEVHMHRVERDFPVGIAPTSGRQPSRSVVPGVGEVLHRALTRGRFIGVAGQLREPACAPVCRSGVVASRWCSRSHSLPWYRGHQLLQRISLGELVLPIGLLVERGDDSGRKKLMIRKRSRRLRSLLGPPPGRTRPPHSHADRPQW